MIIQKLTEDQIKFLEDPLKKIHDAEAGFKTSCKWIRESREYLWEKIKILFPDKNVSQLKWGTKEIIISENTDEHAE